MFRLNAQCSILDPPEGYQDGNVDSMLLERNLKVSGVTEPSMERQCSYVVDHERTNGPDQAFHDEVVFIDNTNDAFCENLSLPLDEDLAAVISVSMQTALHPATLTIDSSLYSRHANLCFISVISQAARKDITGVITKHLFIMT